QQLDLRLLRNLDDATRRRRDHPQTDLLEAERGLFEEHAEQVVGHAAARLLHLVPLIDRRGDDVAGHERALEERAAEHLAGADQPKVLLRRRQLDASCRPGLGRFDGDVIADADAGVAALKAVQPDYVQPLVLLVRREGQRRRRTLAGNLDDVALANAEALQCLAAQARRARAHILRLRARHLQLHAFTALLRHLASAPWC